MNTTREQQLAQQTDRHLAVIANAGSGKTSVLVDRYLRLLLDDVPVREIVAITFTTKAASEMQKRVAEKLEEMLADPARQPEWRKVKEIRERLSGARISTIHSFCARLLRDFPIEAEVNPNFTELGEYEGFTIKRDAIVTTLEEWLEDPERRSRVLHLIRNVGRKEVEEYLTQILSNAELFDEIQHLYDTSDDDLLTARCETIFSALALKRARTYFEHLAEALHNISYTELGKATAGKYQDAMGELQIVQQLFNRLSAQPLWEHIEEILSHLMEARRKVATTKGALTSYVLKGIYDQRMGQTFNQVLEQSFRRLGDPAKLWEHHSYDTLLLSHARAFLALARDARTYIQTEKARLGALDFDDLQIKVAQLLEDPSVCSKIERKLQYLMMDEFQDTNELQYSIARRLVAALQRCEESPEESSVSVSPTNFFIVGDPKQSIYGFRGADVRVFEKARRHIRLVNQYQIGSSSEPQENDDERLGNIRLSASFRLLPIISTFVNRICGTAMAEKVSEFDVEYEPLVCGRQSAAPSSDCGSVSILVAQKRAGTGNEDETESEEEGAIEEPLPVRSSEEELLALHIRKAVESDTPTLLWSTSRTTGEEQSRSARYGDIAVLARSRKGFEKLASAFRRYRIPFVISSGKGFYDRQEILDMRSFLLFLQNKNDDIALAAILRSPYFSITDTELYNISVCKGGSLWERTLAYHQAYEGGGLCSAYFLRAYRILHELLPLAARITIPSLIRMIISQCGWRGMIAADERYEQIEANMEKLLTLAREFEAKGFKNLYDFAEELGRLALHADKEGEAEITVGKDAVMIMTIHASKGLEFPIVALYQANDSKISTPSLCMDTDFGICFKVPHMTPEGVAEMITSPMYYLASQKSMDAEAAEQKRVLYVALTRAKDHLIITATIGINKDQAVGELKGFFKMIVEGLEVASNDLLLGLPYTFSDNIRLLHEGMYREHEFTYKVNIHTLSEEAIFPDTPERREEDVRLPPLLLEELPADIDGDFYSASQLQLFIKDPMEYELIYRLGLPPSEEHTDMDRARILSDGERESSGLLPGTLLHAVLATLPSWCTTDGVQEDIFDETVERTIRNHNAPASEQLSNRIRREVMSVALHPFIQSYTLRLGEARFEHAFHLLIGNDFLIGSVDVLMPDDKGNMEIWDWKTNNVVSPFDIYRLYENYRLQLEVYIYFLSLLYPQQERFTARLLFTRFADDSRYADKWIQTLHVERGEIGRIEMKIRSIMQEIRKVSYGEPFIEENIS